MKFNTKNKINQNLGLNLNNEVKSQYLQNTTNNVSSRFNLFKKDEEVADVEIDDLNQDIFEYDDLSPSKNIALITTHNFNNRFRNDWIKFDSIKFKKILDLLNKQKPELAEFVLTKLDKESFYFLSKLHGVEALDFVVNQYNLFNHEINRYSIINPTYFDPRPKSNFDAKLTQISASYSSDELLDKFRKKTISYFLYQKMVQQNQANELNELLSNYQVTNFLDPIDTVLNKNTIANKFPKKYQLANPSNKNGIYRKRIVGRKLGLE